MKKNFSKAILFLFLFVLPVVLFSQEKTLISPYIQIRYFKNTDGQRSLQTSLTYSKNRMELPLEGMEISFYKGAKKELIASVVTDGRGIAKLPLGNDVQLPVGENGNWALSSEFKGNDTISAGTSEINIRDVTLNMTLLLKDSIKTISLNAFIRENGANKPVSGEIVKLYVPRMFSLLPIGEVTLDEKGDGSLEFPSDLPGDKEGNLTIISKFEENEKFGNIERQSLTKWGTPTQYVSPYSHRALWTKTPPRWMIFTLSVLLAGVWGHYMFAIISLIRIKIDAKRQAKKEYKI